MTTTNLLKPLSHQVDNQNQISIAGIPVKDLAAKYGTPLYILCEQTVRSRAKEYRESLEANYQGKSLAVFASKSLNCKAVCKIMAQEAMGLDVVSAGELYTALSVDFPTDRIIFHGNNKSYEELEMAIENEIGSIMLDNLYELSLIEEILGAAAAQQGSFTQKQVNLTIRITPGIECHTHEYIKTGKIDSKFGFNLEELDSVIEKILELQQKHPNIKIKGLHAHIGSQIFETIPHRDTVKVLLDLYKNIKDKFGLEFEDLNVGGGLGIKYLETDDPPEIKDWIKIITDAVTDFSSELGLKLPRILVEPGRSIVGPAGVTVYKVGNIKDIPNLRKYVAVDGGMSDNVRPIMYQAEYEAAIDGKDNAGNLETVTVAGKYCESGDILIKDTQLPKPEHGDLLLIYSTGAYNYSMASNYNRACKPAMVLVKDGEAELIIKRETFEDLLSHDLVPASLKEQSLSL